jgi:hypothetical protein
MDFYDRLFVKTQGRIIMHKNIFKIIFVLLICHAAEANVTKVKVSGITEPLYMGIFQGSCNDLGLSNLRTFADLKSKGNKVCRYITGKAFDPGTPNAFLKVWQGSAPLTLVAFQSRGAPVKCNIEYDYNTMFVLGGSDGLKCTSPQAKSDPNEEEDIDPTSAPVEEESLALNFSDSMAGEPEVQAPTPVSVPATQDSSTVDAISAEDTAVNQDKQGA